MKSDVSTQLLIRPEDIQSAYALLQGVVRQSPLTLHRGLSEKYQAEILLKREDLQEVRSFKIRGAYYKIAKLVSNGFEGSVACASAGNHAQGVAYACSTLQCKGHIFMPTTTPQQKISKVRHFGGSYVEIILKGDTYDEADEAARAFADEIGAHFIHPFNDREVIAGQGTIGLELTSQMKDPIDFLFVAVGGGGLLAGVGSWFKQVQPTTTIVALEASGAPAFKQSLDQNFPIKLEHIDPFADGIAVQKIGDITFPICRDVHDLYFDIPEGKLCSAMLSLYNDDAIVVEPAGAIGIAALDLMADKIKGKRVVIIVCGGNNDIARTNEIRERALLYEGKKHYFIIRFPQRAGALKQFLQVLGPEDDIAHFEYTKKKNIETGPALVGIELQHPSDYEGLISRMKQHKIHFIPLNQDPMLFEMLV
jgi:threonine dehydratase